MTTTHNYGAGQSNQGDESITEYTQSLIRFLEEKLNDYHSMGVEPTLEALIKDLKRNV